MNKYAHSMIDDFFLIGDIDNYDFYQFLSFVNFDQNDNCLNKSQRQRFEEALIIVKFLMREGVFVGYLNHSSDIQIIENFEQFEKLLRYIYIENPNKFFGNPVDTDFDYGIQLLKVKKGVSAPPITDEVAKIWATE